MLIRGMGVACLTCGMIIGFASAAIAAVPSVPPPSTVGLGESEAKAELIEGGFTPLVISRNGGGANCYVFNQVAVTDYNKWLEDAETSGTFADDDEYTVFLSVNCTS